MRDTISIIFASIFMVLVIVILPLFSILDRQDNIAYNVVLTQTSKFVDEIRANGFITENQYEAFVSSLASTGNTYKVTLEAYKHTLIPATNASGTVIKDTFIDYSNYFNYTSEQNDTEIVVGFNNLTSSIQYTLNLIGFDILIQTTYQAKSHKVRSLEDINQIYTGDNVNEIISKAIELNKQIIIL